jgi:hypothetical protein
MKHPSIRLLGQLRKSLKSLFRPTRRIPDGSDLAMLALAATTQCGGEIASVSVAFPTINRLVTLKTDNDQFVVNLQENDRNLSTRSYQRDDPEFLEKLARIMGSSALIAGAQERVRKAQKAEPRMELN